MAFLADLNWIWPALILAFFLGVAITRWTHQRIERNKSDQVNQEYFKGLSFLLNEQPDKAIEVFIKVLEVDSETVELHLALGGLFRRQGQVDRATRIHQNLIARTSLTSDQRLHAIYELAQDYHKAGLLDRAEDLFLELKDSFSYRQQALDGLCSIYQQEKEWQQAIEVLRLHRKENRPSYSKKAAHFWCELAQSAIDSKQYGDAHNYLQSALNEDSSNARAVLLRGELAYQQQRYSKAIDLWQGMVGAKSSLAELIVDKMIMSFSALKDRKGLKSYLVSDAVIPKNEKAFDVWKTTLTELLGAEAAMAHIFERVQSEGLSGQVASYLLKQADHEQLAAKHSLTLLKDVLNRAKSSNIEYTCGRCGFDTKAMYWHCPNCGEWESFN